jgi:hypothetical protein
MQCTRTGAPLVANREYHAPDQMLRDRLTEGTMQQNRGSTIVTDRGYHAPDPSLKRLLEITCTSTEAQLVADRGYHAPEQGPYSGCWI